MIVWWLLGARILIDVGLIVKYTVAENIVFLGVGGLGLASYLTLFAFVVVKAKRFFSDHTIRQITIIFSIILLGLAAYFGVRSAFVLMG